MKIGELAHAAATPIETIRFYEREGLIPAPERTASNYRSYEACHLQRLVFIRRCRALDMALDEVRPLLAFMDHPGPDCSEVNQVLDEHIHHVTARIKELRALERELRELRARCAAASPGQACGILQGLNRPLNTGPDATSPGAAHSHVGRVHRRAAAGHA